jgi:hypothetical protein
MVSTGIRPAAGDGRNSPLMRKPRKRGTVKPPRRAGARYALHILAALLLLALFALMLQ